jgi:hypothetical protein
MEMTQHCPECGAAWPDGRTCEDHFHQMLFWENEQPVRGVVHHLMVLCYHLQHPRLLAPDGLAEMRKLLAEFVEQGIAPQQVRRRSKARVDSGRRTWKIKAAAGQQARYERPMPWRMTAADVVAAGPEAYVESVWQWARSVLATLKAS